MLGLAFFSLKLLKRVQTGPASDDQIRYLRALPVGQRERLTLVAYRDQVFLLGVTAGQITVLDRRTRSPEEIAAATGDRRTPEEVAEGFLEIAGANMANAIKKISVQRGYDVTRYALNCFGGAGGQHACLVADALGMTKVLIHPFSSLLSAYGMGLADIRATRQQAIEENFGSKSLAALNREGKRLGTDAKNEVAGQGVPASVIKIHVRAHIRYAGTDTPLIVAARQRGHRTVTGLGMLLHQGIPAWKAWFGIEPKVTAELRAKIEATL